MYYINTLYIPSEVHISSEADSEVVPRGSEVPHSPAGALCLLFGVEGPSYLPFLGS